jgi:peroxiredoxin Q/BCP
MRTGSGAAALILGGLAMFGWFVAKADALQPGTPAPAFELNDQYGEGHALADYRGRWVVVYFYPKNDTPGCTTEACAFRDDYLVLRDLGAQVFGVSLDDTESHARFAEKHGLPFPLLSDAAGEVAREYGALFALGPLRFAKRHSFIIDPDGRIAKVYRKVEPDTHSDEIIADLRRLQDAG